MEQEQNRSEQATPHKKEEARKRGQVAKSADLGTFFIISAALVAALLAGASSWRHMLDASYEILGVREPSGVDLRWAEALLLDAGRIVMPFALAAVLGGLLGNIVQNGIIFSFEPLKPQWDRLNPAKGIKRVFNKRVLVEAVKSVLKAVLITLTAGSLLLALRPQLTSLSFLTASGFAINLGERTLQLLWRLTAVLAIVAAADLAWTRWRFGRELMMSRREVREEVRRREGDPQVRARIRELQKENLKQARSIGRVREADVLITNPTHVAVALSYDRGRMLAPCVVAKGQEAWAFRLREEADRHRIPVIEQRMLARELFRRSAIDQPVPSDLFVEVATVYVGLGDRRKMGRRVGVPVEVRP